MIYIINLYSPVETSVPALSVVIGSVGAQPPQALAITGEVFVCIIIADASVIPTRSVTLRTGSIALIVSGVTSPPTLPVHFLRR